MSHNALRILAFLCLVSASSASINAQPVKLPNYRNNCYVNAALQTIYHLPEMSRLIRNVDAQAYNNALPAHVQRAIEYHAYNNALPAHVQRAIEYHAYNNALPAHVQRAIEYHAYNNALLAHVQRAIGHMDAGETEHALEFQNTIYNICSSAQGSSGERHQQQDASEILGRVYTALEEYYIQRMMEVEARHLYDLFHVQQEHYITSPDGEQRCNDPGYIQTESPINMFDLAYYISSSSRDIRHLIRQRYQSEIDYNGHPALCYTYIQQLPSYLSIHLSPYHLNHDGSVKRVIDENMHITEHMTFSRNEDDDILMAERDTHDDIPILERNEREHAHVSYRLKSAIIYRGAQGGKAGHYWSYIREGNQWWRCENTKVTPLSAFPRDWNPTKHGCAPLYLVYERINHEDIPQSVITADGHIAPDRSSEISSSVRTGIATGALAGVAASSITPYIHNVQSLRIDPAYVAHFAIAGITHYITSIYTYDETYTTPALAAVYLAASYIYHAGIHRKESTETALHTHTKLHQGYCALSGLLGILTSAGIRTITEGPPR